MKKRVSIGMIGYSGIGRVHALGYRELPLLYPNWNIDPVLQAVVTRSDATAEAAKREAGFGWATTQADTLYHDDSIDVIDITLPNNLHADTAIAALNAGKYVYCEKPLAASLAEARRIANAVLECATSGTKAPRFGVVFQYRFIPAILRAKRIIDEGRLGTVYSFRAEYLHSGYQDPERPLSWRLDKNAGGTGALGDLGSHVIDLVRYLLGEFSSVQGMLHTFINSRPVARGSAKQGPVSVDDAAWITAKLESGALGTIEASRFATGTLDDLRLWIYGEDGAIQFSLMDPSFLGWYDATAEKGEYGGDRGWKRLESVTDYPGAKAPPPRSPFGWSRAHVESQRRFLDAFAGDREPSPGITDALRVQLILDAVERSASERGAWIDVDKE